MTIKKEERRKLWFLSFYSRNLPSERQKAALDYLDWLLGEYGPVVDAYPSWHPFCVDEVNSYRYTSPAVTPMGFAGHLDHTVTLRDAFIVAPYGKKTDHANQIVDIAHSKNFSVRIIDEPPLYAEGATPVLVVSNIPKESDGTVERRYALGYMLREETGAWQKAQVAETWETMRGYILGRPCSALASPFVNAATGSALRKLFKTLMASGVCGPERNERRGLIDEPVKHEELHTGLSGYDS